MAMLEWVAAIEMMCKDSGKWEAEVIFQLTHLKDGSEIKTLCAKQISAFYPDFCAQFLMESAGQMTEEDYTKVTEMSKVRN